MVLKIGNLIIETNEQGFLLNISDWSDKVAMALAANEHIELTDAHWEIIRFIREYYLMYKHLPNTRMFVKAITKSFGVEKGNSRYLHKLFPNGPLKYACKLAGLPKPPNCI
jgi:tRNA 2-thiouridine synthesizing protein E